MALKANKTTNKVNRVFGIEDKGQLKTFSIRLHEKDIADLTAYFANEKGLKLTQGIRMIINEYKKEHGI